MTKEEVVKQIKALEEMIPTTATEEGKKNLEDAVRMLKWIESTFDIECEPLGCGV